MSATKPIPLSVLQVIPALDAGGAERTAVDVARAVVKAGGKSWIATKGGRLAAEAERAGAKLVIGPFDTKSPFAILRNAESLADLIRRENIAIIHARSRAPAWSAFFAAQRTNAKYVATYHGIYNANNPIKRWYNSIMAKGDAVIANSQFTADHVLAEHKVDPKKLHVIPRGIDIAGFTPAHVGQDRVEAIRKQWQLAPGKPTIVMPGRLTRWKGQLVFIEALAKLSDRYFQAVMVGDAQEREGYVEKLHAALQRLNLAEHVRIPGHCSDMPAAFMAADIIVTPSIEPEAFGRVAVEAQAMGRPVVASRLGAQTETVLEGVTGFLVQPDDADALAQGIARALALPDDQRKAMATKGRQRATNIYSVDAMCAATLKVYRDVISARQEKR